MFEWVRFAWHATRGYRLRPWRSPYLQWRVETYTGKKAGGVRMRDFLHLVWVERSQMAHYVRWLSAMRTYRRGGPEQ